MEEGYFLLHLQGRDLLPNFEILLAFFWDNEMACLMSSLHFRDIYLLSMLVTPTFSACFSREYKDDSRFTFCRTILNLALVCRGTYREHVEDTFRFDAKTLAAVGFSAVVVPVFFYTNIVSEYEKLDEIAGRKPRDFM